MVLEQKVIEHNICFPFSLQLLSETHSILSRIKQDMITLYIGYNGKYQLFLWDFN